MRRAEAQPKSATGRADRPQASSVTKESTSLADVAQLGALANALPLSGRLTQINDSPRMTSQLQAAGQIQHSPRVAAQGRQFANISGMVAQREAKEEQEAAPAQAKPAQLAEAAPKPNNTGLPDSLKHGVESLSGISMDKVRVHYNSDKPAQLSALAYAQGTDIHIAPGQEKHLPHEAWHVVQQAQGRVSPTRQMKGGVAVNDDANLEGEADLMGPKAAGVPPKTQERERGLRLRESPDSGKAKPVSQGVFPVQRQKTVWETMHEVLDDIDVHRVVMKGQLSHDKKSAWAEIVACLSNLEFKHQRWNTDRVNPDSNQTTEDRRYSQEINQIVERCRSHMAVWSERHNSAPLLQSSTLKWEQKKKSLRTLEDYFHSLTGISVPIATAGAGSAGRASSEVITDTATVAPRELSEIEAAFQNERITFLLIRKEIHDDNLRVINGTKYRADFDQANIARLDRYAKVLKALANRIWDVRGRGETVEDSQLQAVTSHISSLFAAAGDSWKWAPPSGPGLTAARLHQRRLRNIKEQPKEFSRVANPSETERGSAGEIVEEWVGDPISFFFGG